MSEEFVPPHDSLRWRKYAGRDVVPLWVADMDFPAPAKVVAALQARCANGLFGIRRWQDGTNRPDTV